MNMPALSTKILLAEDDNDMRRFLVKALQNAGFDVASFDNGLSAYNRLREEPFELLLTDIVMPEMDGIELTQTLRQTMNSAIKIIGVSAGELDNDRQTCLDAGMNDHLSKPFKANDLLNKIQLHACVEKLT